MAFADRLSELRKEKELTQKELASFMGMSRPAFSLYEAGQREPDFELLQRLAEFFQVTTDYLLGKSDYRDPLPPGAYPVGPQVRVPVLGVIRAGAPILAVEHIEGYELVDAETVKNGEFFYLRVTGNSMAPKVQEGYLVLVRKQDDLDDGDVAVVIIDGEDATLKRIYRANGTLVLKSDNPEYAPVIIDRGNVKIIGKAIEFKGKL